MSNLDELKDDINHYAALTDGFLDELSDDYGVKKDKILVNLVCKTMILSIGNGKATQKQMDALGKKVTGLINEVKSWTN